MIEQLHNAGFKSDYAYIAGFVSIGLSFAAWGASMKGEDAGTDRADRWGIFVGHWAPTFFGLGNALHGLDWHWDQDQYRAMLAGDGGQDRIAGYAQSLGQTVDARAVHETKSRLFQENLAQGGLTARPGVVDAVWTVKSNGWKVGFVTTTSAANVAALLDALSPQLSASDFDVIIDSAQVDQPKPDQAAYRLALRDLGQVPGECVAVEDNAGGVQAALAAGVPCVAFPSENTAAGDFPGVQRRVDRLDAAELPGLV